MEPMEGVTPHTIVCVTDKKEKSIIVTNVLKKMRYKVYTVQSLYGALKVIDQELPHLIIVDALLSDGTAGTLFDRLQQHPLVQKTPILVHVSSKTKEQLTPLRGRKFAGFLLGKIDSKTIAGKVKEIMSAHSFVSPYFVKVRQDVSEEKLILSVRAKALGKTGDQVIYLSDSKVEGSASLVCLPEDSQKSPALLKMGSNVVRGEEIYNVFPLSRIRGKGRKWINDLPEIQVIEDSEQELKRVLFFHPNPKRFDQFQEVLAGYGINLVQANSIQLAAAILTREKDSLSCVYLDELTSDASGISFKNALKNIPQKQRPMIIAGTTALNARSNEQVRFIQKPFGLGILVDMIDACCRAKDSFTGESANLNVSYQAQAKLLGLDETGGILQLKFPLVKGSKVHLRHSVLEGLWDGDASASITNIENHSSKNIWQAKFTSSRAIGNKAKYWNKIQKYIHTHLAETVNDKAD